MGDLAGYPDALGLPLSTYSATTRSINKDSPPGLSGTKVKQSTD